MRKNLWNNTHSHHTKILLLRFTTTMYQSKFTDRNSSLKKEYDETSSLHTPRRFYFFIRFLYKRYFQLNVYGSNFSTVVVTR